MLTVVAGERPYDVFTLLDEPLWRVLYLFHHLSAKTARAALDARLARVDAGLMTALARHQPAALDDEMRRVRDAIDDFERGPAERPDDLAAWRARGDALAARIEQGRVLSPEALVPAMAS